MHASQDHQSLCRASGCWQAAAGYWRGVHLHGRDAVVAQDALVPPLDDLPDTHLHIRKTPCYQYALMTCIALTWHISCDLATEAHKHLNLASAE